MKGRLGTGQGYGIAIGAVALGWAICAWPWLSGEVTIPYDAKAHFQPQLQFLAHALHSGQSPFWTPNVFGGSPQIADPQSLIFSPAILLAYWAPAPSFRQLDAFCFLLLALAAFSVLMMFKDRGWHPAGATVAALATSFGGSAIWRIQHIKQIEAFAFFLLCFWLLSRALDRRSIIYGILAGLAASVLVIEPGQVAMLGCYILLGYTIHHWLMADKVWRSMRATLPPLLCGGAIASFIAAIPIVMSFLFVEASNRPDIPYKEAARGALHPASLLTAVVPDLYSASSSLPYWGPASSNWRANWLAMSENMGQIYIGALPVLLIVGVGLSRGRLWARDIRFFTAAAAALLVYALGRYTGGFLLLYDYVPGVDLFRRPADATYALGAMTAIVAGYVLHRLLTDKEPLRSSDSLVVGGVLVAAFATAIGVAEAHHRLHSAAPAVLSAGGFFIGGWLLLLAANRPAWTRLAFLAVPALAAFMTLDLAVNNGPNRSTAKPPSEFDELRLDTKNETVSLLKARLAMQPDPSRRDRVEIVGLGFEWPNIGLIHNFDHTLGYNPIRLGEIVEGMGADETVAEARQRRFTPLFPSYRSFMADYLGLRYIAVNQPIEAIDKKLRPGDLTLIANTHEAYVYENARALPRVMFVPGWRLADFDQMARSGQWPDFDPKRTVLLAAPPPTASAPARPSLSAVVAPVIRSYRNTEVEVDVEAPSSGFLILNDVWQLWWYGSVDGAPAEILRANVLFRAIQVPAGRHIVRFDFKPVSGAWKEVATRVLSRSKAAGSNPTLTPGPLPPPRPEATEQGLSKAAAAAPETLRSTASRTHDTAPVE